MSLLHVVLVRLTDLLGAKERENCEVLKELFSLMGSVNMKMKHILNVLKTRVTESVSSLLMGNELSVGRSERTQLNAEISRIEILLMNLSTSADHIGGILEANKF